MKQSWYLAVLLLKFVSSFQPRQISFGGHAHSRVDRTRVLKAGSRGNKWFSFPLFYTMDSTATSTSCRILRSVPIDVQLLREIIDKHETGQLNTPSEERCGLGGGWGRGKGCDVGGNYICTRFEIIYYPCYIDYINH